MKTKMKAVVLGVVFGCALGAAQADATTDGVNRAVKAARQLRASMNDPASFELAAAHLHKDGLTCLNYRGKNAFNATLTKAAVVTAGEKWQLLLEGGSATGKFAKAWNGTCTQSGAEDITRMVRRFMD